MLFFRQLDWKEFVNQPHIKKLTLNEQMQQFNFHLQQMSNLNKFQPKGRSNNTSVVAPSPKPQPVTPSPTPEPTAAPTPQPVTPSPTPQPTAAPTPQPTAGPFTPSGTEYTLDGISGYSGELIDITNSTPQEVVDYYCANGTLATGGPFGGYDSWTLQKAVGNTSSIIEVGDRVIIIASGLPVSSGTRIAPDNDQLLLNDAAQVFNTVSDGVVTSVVPLTC